VPEEEPLPQIEKPVWESPEVPVPEGETLAQLEAVFRTWSIDGSSVGSLDGYVNEALWRFLHTWGLARHEKGTCLELGANPYFLTHLLNVYTNLDVSLANFFDERFEQRVAAARGGEMMQTVSFVDPNTSEPAQLVCRSRLFNIEEDQFPYASNSFDVVLFCEIIEHLLMNPLAALRQIHRVLKPEGRLILTTPNVARLENVIAMIRGTNIFDPYSGFGPYGRHNREYTRLELLALLEFAGFEVEHCHTADAHQYGADGSPLGVTAERLLVPRREDLGQYLFVRARPARMPREGLPSFLFRSWPEEAIVEFTCKSTAE
jgi:SAM-dependent methyltransferase